MVIVSILFIILGYFMVKYGIGFILGGGMSLFGNFLGKGDDNDSN